MQEFPGKSRSNPFFAAIKERTNLSLESAKKITQHIVLDIAGSNLDYSVGDSVGVLPTNPASCVQEILTLARFKGDEVVVSKRDSKPMSLADSLKHFVNITDLTKGFIETAFKKMKEGEKKEKIARLLKKEAYEDLKRYLEAFHLIDFLKEFEDVLNFSKEELISGLKPLLPRFYSIASSSKYHPEEIHLTVVLLAYELFGDFRKGICTSFLSEAAMNEKNIPIFLQASSGFTLPENHETPIIMVGPGTGVAPFRAFLQERKILQAKGKNWLFFGERNQSNSFFYKDFFLQLKEEGFLELDLAFSRDQEEKVYVQHRMKDKGEKIFSWLESGGYIYVCGDAKKMARDVESVLLEIIMLHGKLTLEEAKAYIKELKRQKRYLKDVY